MRICMASDFMFPNMGGVEEHIFNLSQCLIDRGHKVVVITHLYGDRKGIRYMTNGLKVYYLPIKVCYNQCIVPTMVCNVPLLRNVLIREQIDIVHGHSAFSALSHEAMFVGKLMGLRVVFTDHSLFGFADLSAVITNKLLEICLSTCNHCICVSHIGKENTVLRAKVPKKNVSVIPNAVDTAHFTPNPINRQTDDQIKIVVISRLVYRKGVDLIAGVIYRLRHYPNIQFIIGGDGPKRGLLEEVRERANMQDRVTMLGALEHAKVRDVLTQGHIFLNASLTEAYCMAIVEAASCGLQVVSTKVGGIPEVLPSELILLTEPTVESVLSGVMTAVERLIAERNARKGQNSITNGSHNIIGQANGNSSLQNRKQSSKNRSQKSQPKVLCPFECNEMVANLYNWDNVTMRTVKVYKKVLKERDPPFGDKLNSYMKACVPYMLVVSFVYLLLRFLDWYEPRHLIDLAPDLKMKAKIKNQRKRDGNNDKM
ncbi:phosphatidylinositol N-acetylglucosaminyltransferase subunit A isoform X2 [Bradysia coprophila]|uniref:phosphatidylinositol N-acetylglucosaminyltransferase subunit A isoform X2 n=1 Tax=Bradysia coprophila TaxID=38358 RepID=UPI00187D7884|nr:phosphatidylinositol N-acetylglucosaminyltransferase subunit A isoform X2 [Bradysia coprophila]